MSLDWLNPFWSDITSHDVGADPGECAERLRPLTGRPSPFDSAPTAGRAGRDGFDLVCRSRNGAALNVAVGLCRGTFERHGTGTRVAMEIRHAPGALMVFGLVAALALVAVFTTTGDPMWRWFLPTVFVLGWIVGSWVTARNARALRELVIDVLSAGAAQPRGDRARSTRRRDARRAQET